MSHAIAMIGLGKMGGNMARRLAQGGVNVHGFDVNLAAAQQLAAEENNITAHADLASLVAALPTPRTVWMMLPAGAISESTLQQLLPLMSAGDLIVDGANAMYKDAQARAVALAAQGFKFADAGVSGGVWGLANGYTIMLGGDQAAIDQVKPFIQILAPGADKGWMHCGPAGAGHYAKMVHNGIEYGMMQSFAEGFALLKAKTDFNIDLGELSETWRHGSVIRSWLLDLVAESFQHDTEFTDIKPIVPDSGEGRWTVLESIDLGVPTPTIASSLYMRFASQGQNDYAAKVLSVMRNAFGGHNIIK